ncbi:hypothetical protein ACFQ2B_39015 [Streptomyces stramineus]
MRFPAPAVRQHPLSARAGGGALLDAGVYTLRAAGLGLGWGLRVEGATLRRDRARGVDAGGAALVSTPDGRTGQLSFGFDRAYRCAYSVWGSEGSITLPRAFTAPPGLRPVLRLERQDHVEKRTLSADDQVAALVSAFVTTILQGEDLIAPGEDILRQAHLLEAVREAVKDSRRR